MTDTLADALPREQKRVRELITIYPQTGPVGIFAITMMQLSLEYAEKAASSGDTVAMIRALEDLRGYKE